MRETVQLPLLYPETFRKLGIDPPKGVLLYGPPGTGKTFLAREIARTEVEGKRLTFFHQRGAELLSKFHGESERKVRDLFTRAQIAAPSVIFLDEVDGLAPKRSPKQNQVYSSVVTTLLSLLDGIDSKSRRQVFVIAATNRPEMIDPALRRPGRFDREIYVPLPSKKAREAILRLYTKRWTPSPPEQLLNDLAEKTRGYSGAELRALAVEASLAAVRRQFPSIFNTKGEETSKPQFSAKDWKTISVNHWDFQIALEKCKSRRKKTDLPLMEDQSLHDARIVLNKIRDSVLSKAEKLMRYNLYEWVQPSLLLESRDGDLKNPLVADVASVLLSSSEFHDCEILQFHACRCSSKSTISELAHAFGNAPSRKNAASISSNSLKRIIYFPRQANNLLSPYRSYVGIS